jgi:hypothetical protein
MPPDQPTPEERGYGTQLLKQLMWENLGLDNPGRVFDDSATVQDTVRKRETGQPTIGDLNRYSREMEQNQQRATPEILAPPAREHLINLVPVEHNPHNPFVTLVATDKDPFAGKG